MLNTPKEKFLIIRSNFGDDSIALTQWVYEQNLAKTNTIKVIYIETGWAAKSWAERIQKGRQHANKLGFSVEIIQSKISFEDAVLGRKSFPTEKFQWCSGLLKGLPLVEWLDTHDIHGEAIILMAKRRETAIAHQSLNEWVSACQFHSDRTVWHPILNLNTQKRDELLESAGFSPLKHRSLECHPCVNGCKLESSNLISEDKRKLDVLLGDLKEELREKKELGETTTFNYCSDLGIDQQYMDLFNRGCGNHFGCGL